MAFSFSTLARRLCLLAGLLLGLAATGWAQAPAWQPVVLAAPTGGSSAASIAATVADAAGNIYVAGYFAGAASLGGSSLGSTVASDVFVAKWLPATQRFAWVLRTTGGGAKYPTGLATSGGQVYVVGYFDNTATFGGTTLTSAGATDIFVAKLTDTGGSASWNWAQRSGGPDFDQANAVAVSGTAVYVAGTFASTVTFGSTAYTSVGSADAFLTKLTDLGNSASYGWTQVVSGLRNDYAAGVAAQGGQVYVMGLYSGTIALGSYSLSSGTNLGIFVAKLADAGSSSTYTWVQQAGSTSGLLPSALVVQGSQLYLAGRHQGTATFGSLSVPNASTASGAYDVFVAKLADAGATASYVWALGAGGPLSDVAFALAVQGSQVYVAGGYSGTASFGSSAISNPSGTLDAFVARLTDAGPSASWAWAQSAGGPSTDLALTLAAVPNAVYVGGYLFGTATFGSQTVGSASAGQTGFFAALPDATGLAATAAAAPPVRVALFPTPTPTGTLATVQLPAGLAAGEATLTLLDALGRAVRTRTVALAAGSTATTFDVAGLAPGVYALRVAVGGRVGTARLVVE